MSDLSLLQELLEQPLSDVLIGGYVENEGDTPRFVGWYESVYLKFPREYLRISRHRGDTTLTFETVDRVGADFEVEEDDSFCTSSL